VSLEGTLETIALPDVLALLSVTAKTGELRIESGGGVGSVWFDAGRVSGFEVGNHRTPVDALFALLRLREGNFKFHTGTQPVNPMTPQDVAPVLDEAENRLVQWPSIASAIPSLYCDLSLSDSVDGTIMLRPDQWELIVSIGGGHKALEVLGMRGLGEFDGCRALKELIDLRLVQVGSGESSQVQPMAYSPPPYTGAHGGHPPTYSTSQGMSDQDVDQGQWSEAQVDDDDVRDGSEVADLSQVWDNETGEYDNGGQEVPPEASQEPVNRGLLLKFLGSARN
jgi:hypothetical protein